MNESTFDYAAIEQARLDEERRAETEKHIVTDCNLSINVEREAVAHEQFEVTIGMVCEICSVHRIDALKRMITGDEVDINDKDAVYHYLWREGLSEEVIAMYMSELEANA